MADEKLVKMKVVNRYYPRGGVDYPPGEVIEVPEHVAKSMEESNPPHGERVSEPTPKKPAAVPA